MNAKLNQAQELAALKVVEEQKKQNEALIAAVALVKLNLQQTYQ